MAMERHRPKGDKAITEFDRLFEIGYRALVESLTDSAVVWPEVPQATSGEAPADAELIECLQSLTEPLLRLWLAHSRSVRLSVLERVGDAEQWNALVKFIERYGHDLFTQAFMNQGRLRTILDQGVETYLRSLEDEPGTGECLHLIEDLGKGISHAVAAEQLHTIIEAVVENYSEYKDFNATTTQSDRGEKLYTLLDFLRLKTSYDRVSWNIRPVVLAHEVLVRRGRSAAAELWHRAGRADRGSGRRAPGAIQRTLPALPDATGQHRHAPGRAVCRAWRSTGCGPWSRRRFASCAPAEPGKPSRRLEQDTAEFAEQAEGSGLESPPWLAALEAEVAQEAEANVDRDLADELAAPHHAGSAFAGGNPAPGARVGCRRSQRRVTSDESRLRSGAHDE